MDSTSPETRYSTDSNAASLARNPVSGGMPAIDSTARPPTAASTGTRRPTPLSSRRSRVPAEWSMTPTHMNSVDLNSAWAMTMPSPARAAASVPSPTRRTMNPSWLTVP